MPNAAFEMLVATNRADSERWSALVFDSPMSDVYYLPAYAQATSEIERSEPVAILAGTDSCRFLAPLLIRRMSAVVNGSSIGWNDAYSPYGYGGLLRLSGCGSTDMRSLHCFLNKLRNWCYAHDVVCCVLRLHPLFRQEERFPADEQNPFRLELRGPTTVIDLENWDDASDRPCGMRKEPPFGSECCPPRVARDMGQR